jgi:hypothetical protein
MTKPLADTVVTADMLLDAIDGCGLAFGKALRIALGEVGASDAQLQRISRVLHESSSDASWVGPDAHCFTNIVTGFLEG